MGRPGDGQHVYRRCSRMHRRVSLDGFHERGPPRYWLRPEVITRRTTSSHAIDAFAVYAADEPWPRTGLAVALDVATQPLRPGPRGVPAAVGGADFGILFDVECRLIGQRCCIRRAPVEACMPSAVDARDIRELTSAARGYGEQENQHATIARTPHVTRMTDVVVIRRRAGGRIRFEEETGGYLHTEGLEGAKTFALWPLSQAAQSCFGKDSWPRRDSRAASVAGVRRRQRGEGDGGARGPRLSDAREKQEGAVGTDRQPVLVAGRTAPRDHVHAVDARGEDLGGSHGLGTAHSTGPRRWATMRSSNRRISSGSQGFARNASHPASHARGSA